METYVKICEECDGFGFKHSGDTLDGHGKTLEEGEYHWCSACEGTGRVVRTCTWTYEVIDGYKTKVTTTKDAPFSAVLRKYDGRIKK